ncbi:MAG: AAA family ATPase [Deltaproteobacteria bacterium]|nr:AAA family ATPase [Deltaproteobacteria bacterium]
MIDLSEFFSIQRGLLTAVPRASRRFLEKHINWDVRLLGIVGGRGTGKTTLLLQYLADHDKGNQKQLYISADHIRVQAAGLYEIASSFFRLGGEVIIIDEIHKYPGWHQQVKNIYDAFPTSRLFFSGSSTLALQKGKADLSRRAVYYTLPGLSFREYIHFVHGAEFEQVQLEALIQNHSAMAAEVVAEGPILGWFRDYLDHGVYPFFLEGIQEYHQKLSNVTEKVLYEDIPAAIGIKTANIPVLKRILWLITTSQPFSPNIERMSRDLKISKPYIYTYLDCLERAKLTSACLPAQTGYRLVRKPSKIYMENTNLLRTVAGESGLKEQPGAVRETFFAHQLKAASLDVRIPERADFLVEDTHVFELGGRSKGKTQIKGIQNPFVVRDDIDTGVGNTIPLWLFGFLY